MKNHQQGVILGAKPFMKQERELTTEQKSVLEKAGETCGFSWRIRTIPRENTAEASRKEWVRLIVAAAKTSNRR